MMKTKRRKRNRDAFTLVEVMVVLFILLAMAGAGVVAIQGVRERAKRQQAELFVKSMKTPLGLFESQIGRFPTTEEGLDALKQAPSSLPDPSKWDSPFVEPEVSYFDPWGNAYQYMYPGTHSQGKYDLWSMGPDGISDTEDDIGSWK